MGYPDNDETRTLSREAAKSLAPGSRHYTAFVGPPQQYDFMGATQFRLLTALGLREHHRLLDFGCGSLRTGRLLIPYLPPERYFGLEPNSWLVEDAIKHELGQTQIDIKRPTFRYDDDFTVSGFGVGFDFILAQSIFSHSGIDVVLKSLSSFRSCLNEGGLILATFIPPHMLGGVDETTKNGWIYPDCVAYKPETVFDFIREAGLVGRELPWFHPRQRWFAMAHTQEELPPPADDIHLSGMVLRAPDLRP